MADTGGADFHHKRQIGPGLWARCVTVKHPVSDAWLRFADGLVNLGACVPNQGWEAMAMRSRVDDALKTAMRNRETLRLSTLRLINAAIKDKEIAKRGDGGDEAVSDTEILGLMGKMVKQRHESARAYEEGGRLELADQEREEISVIEEFLPRKLDTAATTTAINAAIAATGAEGIRDMGRVMAELKGKYTGQLDFGKVGPMVKDRLG